MWKLLLFYVLCSFRIYNFFFSLKKLSHKQPLIKVYKNCILIKFALIRFANKTETHTSQCWMVWSSLFSENGQHAYYFNATQRNAKVWPFYLLRIYLPSLWQCAVHTVGTGCVLQTQSKSRRIRSSIRCMLSLSY